MSDRDHLDDQAVVEDLIEDPVVTDSDPVGALFARQGHAAWWAGLIRQKVDGRSDPLLLSSG